MTRRTLAYVLAAVTSLTPPLHAQAMLTAADSAATARAAWADGTRAWQARDFKAAHTAMERAARTWPTQPAYLWAETLTAALTDDTLGVLQGLRDHLAVGLGRDLARDTILRRFRRVPEIDAAARAVEANAKPLVRSVIVGRLSDSTFWPEGVDYDPRSRSYFLASIRHRTITQLRADGSTRELWPREHRDIGAVMGVRVDTARGVLWATMSGVPVMQNFAPADTALSALLRIRTTDGVIEKRWDIPAAPGGHALGDLAVAANGDVFFTDSNHPVLYRLHGGRDSLEQIRSPFFRSLQGMAPTADGRFLYVADYSVGLLRVDLATHAVVRLRDAANSTSIGCDGILLDATGAIIAVQNGVAPARIMRFALDATGLRIVTAEVLDQNMLVADEPTIATIARGMVVYVANSQWDKHADDGSPRLGIPLTAPILLGIPLATLTGGKK